MGELDILWKNNINNITFPRVPHWLVDDPQKKPHFAHLWKPRFQIKSKMAPVSKIWEKKKFLKYGHIIYHFLAFFMMSNLFSYNKVWKLSEKELNRLPY